MDIKGAIFDMDGTLINSLIAWEILWDEFSKKYLNGKVFVPEKDVDKAIRTLPLKEAMDLMYDRYGFGESGDDLLNTANEVFARFYETQVEVKAGATEFLEYLLQKGVKMCVASATAPNLVNLALKHCKLEKYFLKFFSCADLGLGKDKPEIFNLAHDFLGTPKNETFVFEDSLVAIDTASKAGFKTVGIYDKCNEGAEELKKIATYFIDKGETLEKLI